MNDFALASFWTTPLCPASLRHPAQKKDSTGQYHPYDILFLNLKSSLQCFKKKHNCCLLFFPNILQKWLCLAPFFGLPKRMAGYQPRLWGGQSLDDVHHLLRRFKTPTGQQDVPLLGGAGHIHPTFPEKKWRRKSGKEVKS